MVIAHPNRLMAFVVFAALNVPFLFFFNEMYLALMDEYG